MGLLNDKIREVGSWVGDVIWDVGIALNFDPFIDLGRDIYNACTEKVASLGSYDKTSSSAFSVDMLSNVLASFSKEYMQKVEKTENQCIKIVESCYDDLIEKMDAEPDFTYNNANLRILKREREKVGSSISGSVKESLARRMSLDDAECLEILKMDAGKEKGEAMSAFISKVIREALNNLAHKVSISMKEQYDLLEEYFKNMIDERERNFKNLKEQFDKMCMNYNSETEVKESALVDLRISLDTINEVEKILIPAE